ncbi:MAG: TIGR03790 family protein [Planctomycetes bacterium]|nr:TIGR03790 family protein [Planctomycetota bacterium]
MRWLALCMFAACSPLWAFGPDNVLIVANDKAAGSVEIAEYYARARGIAPARILRLSTSEAEEIDRETFNKQIWEPVTKAVLADDSIMVIVPTRGVPLKVKEVDREDDNGAFAGRDWGSVDGELALIRNGEYDVKGIVENPVFDKAEPLTAADKILVVSRLDGATVEIAKGLVEKAILAEALGCSGESFLDTRGLTKEDGYTERDNIMEKVEDSWKAAKLPYVHDTQGDVVDLSTRAETLHYYGWYAGTQKPAGAVKFRTGGICIHLHSFSASTVRGENNWVGPLLRWNATCSYGTVYEPYTLGFPFENVFWDRLIKGWNFGEAGQVANRLLSWQAVFCGDPLYTPYPGGYAATHERYRKAVALSLLPVDGADPVDTEGLTLMPVALDLLKARQQAILDMVKTDAVAALDALADLRFLVKGMNLDAWLEGLSKPFDAELERLFAAMKAKFEEDVTDTADFESALERWQGLSIHAALLEFKDKVAKDQEKDAGKLLRKAQAEQKGKRWLKAWMLAAQTAAHKFAPSAEHARAIMDTIKADKAALDQMTADADKALKPDVEKAQKELDKGKPDRAAKTLGSDWRWYPDCAERKAAEKLAKEIDAALAKG